jgi:hypothetical protein
LTSLCGRVPNIVWQVNVKQRTVLVCGRCATLKWLASTQIVCTKNTVLPPQTQRLCQYLRKYFHYYFGQFYFLFM